MKRVLFFIVAAVSLLCSCGESTGEKLLIAGSGWDRIAIMDRDSKTIEWEYILKDGQKCNSVDYLGDGKVLFAHTNGASVVTRDHEILWTVDAPKGAEMQTAHLLPDGRCLLAWNGDPLTILEVDAQTGEVLHKTEYNTLISNVRRQTRQVNKMRNGNYLVPLFATQDVVIITPEGEEVKRVKVGGTPFGCYYLEYCNNYLVPCGDLHVIREVDFVAGVVVDSIDEYDIEGLKISFAAGMAFTDRGTTYLCNWQGHDTSSTMPQIVEFDENKMIVWSLDDKAQFGQIADICIVRE